MTAAKTLAALAIVFALSGSAAFAQTTPTTPTTPAATPGTPATGPGDVNTTMAVLGASALVAIAGAAYAGRRYFSR